jgi:hypothetical protein
MRAYHSNPRPNTKTPRFYVPANMAEGDELMRQRRKSF